ncbi:MAG: aldo/keto reductase [Mariniphaga sp.]|nr:aldo/keto reductase [Mariniphaga sp.]
MKRIDRRRFINQSAKGIAGAVVASGLSQLSFTMAGSAVIDKVNLGETGLKVPRLALGTGSFGYRRTSHQKELGFDSFMNLAKHAYDRGMRFFETADMYGTHEFVGKVLKEYNREDITVLSKVMVYDHQDWYKTEPFETSIDRFRKELGTDYIDVLLLHCMVNGEWTSEYKKYMDGFLEAKEKGIIKKIGVSCHNLDALKVASTSPWVDVVQARINHDGSRMDGSPDEVMPVLETAKKNGKGVVGMKIFGCGRLVEEEQREKSLNYVIKSGNVDCMTIGFESIEQLDDAVDRIARIVAELNG